MTQMPKKTTEKAGHNLENQFGWNLYDTKFMCNTLMFEQKKWKCLFISQVTLYSKSIASP